MDDQSQPQQPMQPDQTPLQTHPESGKKKYLIAGIVALVSLLLLAVASVIVVSQLDKNGGGLGGLLKPGFTDWLEPSKEINVGTERYVSPCQVLPQDEVTKLYGNFGSAGYITEEYLDQTPPKKESEVRSRCSYQLDNDTISSVEVVATQYRDASDIKRLGTSLGLTDVEDAEKALTDFKQTLGNSENKDAKQLIDRFTGSIATYKKYDRVYDDKGLADLKTDGLLVPSDSNITLLQGNTSYVFSYRAKAAQQEPDTEALIGYIARINKTIDVIEKNAKDATLKQSPARTVIGTTDMIGSTRILEPCAILTPAIFNSVTGRDQNDTVKRLSSVYDGNKDRFSKADKSIILPYNSCERRYSRYNDDASIPTTPSVSMSLELQYAKTEQAAKDYLTKYYPLKASDTKLQTHADWAQQVPMQDLLDANNANNMYFFRVGPYIGQVDIRLVVSEGLASDIIQSEGTHEQYVRAINELVDSLKAHQKKANE